MPKRGGIGPQKEPLAALLGHWEEKSLLLDEIFFTAPNLAKIAGSGRQNT